MIFGFKKEQLATTDFAVTCYLIAHPKGALMWDVGVIPDSGFKGDGAPVTQGVSTVTRPLKPQLAALGYSPPTSTTSRYPTIIPTTPPCQRFCGRHPDC